MTKIIQPLCYLLPCLLLTACFASRTEGPKISQPTTENSDSYDGRKEQTTARKLLYAATLGLTVEAPDSTLAQIVDLATTMGGYFSRTDANEAVIRVPAERLEEAMEQLETMGTTRYKRLSGEDVTEQYLDYGIRLDNAEKSRQRYLSLLNQATTVAETLLIEKELERLATAIEVLKGKRNRLDQLEAMATITVQVEKKVKLGPLGAVFKGLFAGVKWLFVRN